MESRTAKEEGRSPRWRELGPVEREGHGKAATGFLRDTQARPLQPPCLLWEATVQPAVFSSTVLGGSKSHPRGQGSAAHDGGYGTTSLRALIFNACGQGPFDLCGRLF